MEETIYINHLKNSYRTQGKNGYIAITKTSCYFLNEITNDLIDILPLSGTKNQYLNFLNENNINNGEKLIEKLLSLGILIKQEKLNLLKTLSKLISIDIQLISPHIQGKIFKKLSKINITKKIKKGIFILIVLFFIINIYLFFSRNITLNSNQNFYALIILIIIGSLIHEIGHSYMMYSNGFGARNIGLFIYLIYPSFYVNISGIEKLKVSDKVLSNLGGFIFQIGYCLLLISLYFVTKTKLFLIAYAYSCFLMIFNLNPFLRTDGYWVYQDLYESYKEKKSAKIINLIYLSISLCFTIWFSMNLLKNTNEILISFKNYFLYKKDLVLNFKMIFSFYLMIIMVKAGINKVSELKNEFYRTFDGKQIGLMEQKSVP
jgi:putative peptide zinc metalloprotease protein